METGDWAAARDFSDRGLEVSPLRGPLLYNRVILEYEVGNFHQGEAYLQRLVELTQHAPQPSNTSAYTAQLMPLVDRITGTIGQLDEPRRLAEAVISSPSAVPRSVMIARRALALIAVLQGEVATAEKQYRALTSVSGTMVTDALAIDRLLGLLSQTMGNLDQAATHFEDALAFCRSAGYRVELAWTCHDYVEALLNRNRNGDRTKAKSMLEESLSISTDLGMRPLMERAIALQAEAQAITARAPAYPDGLTQREVDVLCLIAAGKTDREIAEELFIGVRTVSTHVSNILNKTNAANRTEAASYANKQGLV